MTSKSETSVAGLAKRMPQHQWDGRIESLRVAAGALPEEALVPEPAKWTAALVRWEAAAGPGENLSWSGTETPAPKSSPGGAGLADLCHVLLNTNEFFYLQ